MRVLCFALKSLCLLVVVAGAAFAQPASKPQAPPQNVSGKELSVLIRGTIIALHQANVTGNYSVLRDLGSVAYQAANSPARLSELFAEFRRRRLDLSAAILIDARLDGKPQLFKNGVLKVAGWFPTRPSEITFAMTFRHERRMWRITTMRVGTRVARQSGAPDAPVSLPELRSGG